MNKQSRLELLENLSLLGSGVGAVASIVFNQASFAVAPLSLTVALGVLNRRADRDKQQESQAAVASIDQRLSQQYSRLHHQVANLPTPETIHQLSKGIVLRNRELAEHLYAEISTVQDEFQQRFERLEQQDLNTICQDILQLNEQYSDLSKTVAQFQADLAQITDSTRIDQVEAILNHFNLEIGDLQNHLERLSSQTKPALSTLQERVNRLDRLLSKLPPPVDVTSLKREVAELIRIIGELVPKRDVMALSSEVKDLRQQQETLQQALTAIEQTTNHRSHLSAQALDVAALQRQLNTLAQQLPQPTLTTHLHLLEQELHHTNDRLQSLAHSRSELIFDFAPASHTTAHVAEDTASHQTRPEPNGSRAVLMEALDTTRDRLIWIYPWSEQCPLDQVLVQNLEAFLSQKRRISLGWCHQVLREENIDNRTVSDTSNGIGNNTSSTNVIPTPADRMLKKMRRGWRIDSQLSQLNDLQNTLRQLLRLKQAYPDWFQFKILGTRENFLVSDRTFAVIGMAAPLKSATLFPEVHFKLRTSHSTVIQQLIDRFDDASLPSDNLVAHWNRAFTCHDLGDYPGAIADYTHLLMHQPNDATVYNNRGAAYCDSGHNSGGVEAAIEDFTRSIQLNPRQTAAYCNRGFLQAERTHYREALQDFSTAIQNQPNCAIAYFYRALTQQKQGQHQAALSDYTEAIRLTPDTATAYYYRSQAWQKLEQYEAAIDDLVQATERFTLQGSKANAQKAQKQLAQLRRLTASSPSSKASPNLVG